MSIFIFLYPKAIVGFSFGARVKIIWFEIMMISDNISLVIDSKSDS